jgi:citryl-CoA synthetase large subunit
MILFEFEGKELLSKFGINIPKSQVIRSKKEKVTLRAPLIVKAQVLSGKRKDAGGIGGKVTDVLGKVVNNESVDKVLIEEMIEHKKEYYLSISYDTATRGPILTFSGAGGTGIESRKVETYRIDPILHEFAASKNSRIPIKINEVIPKLIDCFFSEDLTLLEINPIVIGKDGKVYALDAKVKTDDSAGVRHPNRNFLPRSVPGHTPTEREIKAKKIDEGDYRGTAGSTYFDLPGDIAVLASGGGASLTAMDALLSAGGTPSNYTEYSGNPPKEKVEKLTKIVLSKPNLRGLWVVGAVANFTDIYETLSGFLDALRAVKPKPSYPIVIRRGGPKDKEAFEMLKKVRDFDLHLYGQEISITESAKIMVKLANKYATTT